MKHYKQTQSVRDKPMHALHSFIYFCFLMLLPACGGTQRSSLVPKANPKKTPTVQQPIQKAPSPELLAPTQRRKQKKQEVEARKQRLQMPKKTLKEMNTQELALAKSIVLEQENKELAVKYAERMLSCSTDLEELKELRLECADLNFDIGNLEKAEELYAQYVSFYPNSELIEYAEYKTILSCFYQMLDAERDQSKTKQAMNIAKDFLAKPYHAYHDDIRLIEQQCLETLFEHEVSIINFYFSQDKLTAAEQRLTMLRDHYAALLPAHEPTLLALECTLAERHDNKSLVEEKERELARIRQITGSKIVPEKPDYVSFF